MDISTVKRLSDEALRRDLLALAAESRRATARLLVAMAEFDARRLYLPEGYSSMYLWCVGVLGLSEESAYKRIRVARVGRQFPAIFAALAEGRLHLSAVVMLASHLNEETAAELLAAAEHQSKSEIERLLAKRFPRPDVPTSVQGISSSATMVQPVATPTCQELSPGTVDAAGPRSRVSPLAPQRFAVTFTIGQDEQELLEEARGLLSHRSPRCDAAEVFVRALRSFVPMLKKRRYGAGGQSTRRRADSDNPRHIPARVRRAVHERDRGQCTFVGRGGHRCLARTLLEYDHIEPVARGGKSTVDNLRLRCRAHNRYAAEQLYGTGLVKAKIEEAQREAAKRRAEEVVPWLQALGIRADHARQAAERCAVMPHATLEERVKAALSCFGPRDVQWSRAAPAQ